MNVPMKRCRDVFCEKFCPLVSRLPRCLDKACFPFRLVHAALGSRACLTSLEQVRQGPFTLEHALPSYRWSWEEASATSRKLADLWGPCIAQVRQEMEHQRALFEGRARYY